MLMWRIILSWILLFIVDAVCAQDLSAAAVGEFKEALEKARAGQVIFQNDVGYFYDVGYGTTINYQKAVYWYQKAADQGNAYGIGNMGCMYKYGKYVKRNYAKAIKMLKEGGDKGNPDGYYELGDCYEKGIGVAKNLEKAYMYYRKAADMGYEKGKKAAAALESKRGTGPNGRMIASGTYTSTGVFRQGTQYGSSGSPTLTSFKIYENCLFEGNSQISFPYVGTETCDNLSCRRYGTNNDSYYLVTSNGMVRKVFSFSANYPMLGVVRTTSVMYYDKGDTRASYQQGVSNGYGGYASGSSASQSTARKQHKCGLCGGKGWIGTDEGVTDFGSGNKKWCKDCNKYVYMNHYHKSCPSCGGKGKW